MLSAKKVLVIDDDDAQLAVIEGWLASAGFEVIAKNSPIGTTQVVLTHRPDLILIDWDMPILAGPEVVDILQKRLSAIPFKVVFYSGKPAAVLDQVVADFRPLALGSIRKTSDGGQFLSQFNRLVGHKPRASAAPTPSPEVRRGEHHPTLSPPQTRPVPQEERRACFRVRPKETEPVYVWIATPRGEFKLTVEDLSIATPKGPGGLRLRLFDAAAREVLSIPGRQFHARVQLPGEKQLHGIRITVVWSSLLRSAPEPMSWLSVTYQVDDPASEPRFQAFFTRLRHDTGHRDDGKSDAPTGATSHKGAVIK